MKYYTVDWLGSFTYRELKNLKKSLSAEDNDLRWKDSSLYLVVGAKKWNRKVENRCVQYVGMTRQNCAFRIMQHFDEQRENDDKFQELKLDEIGFWIGVFVPLTKDIKKEAHLLEHALIHCTKPPLNVNAKINPAKEDITILSRFYKKRDPDQVCKNQPKTLRNVPDVIMWDGKRYYTADRLKPTENE